MGANCDVCGLPYPLEDLEEIEIPDERIMDTSSLVVICEKCKSFFRKKFSLFTDEERLRLLEILDFFDGEFGIGHSYDDEGKYEQDVMIRKKLELRENTISRRDISNGSEGRG